MGEATDTEDRWASFIAWLESALRDEAQAKGIDPDRHVKELLIEPAERALREVR